MILNYEESRSEALQFLKKNRTGVLATLSAQEESRARLLYYFSDDDFCIYFMTLISTRKYDDLKIHPQAAFVVATLDVPQTLQIEGLVSDITKEWKTSAALAPLVEIMLSDAKYFAPITKLDPAKVVLMKLTPTWIRFSNYALIDHHGTLGVHTEIIPTRSS